MSIAYASPTLGLASDTSRLQCVKTVLSRTIDALTSLPDKAKNGIIQWGKEVKEQGPIRLVLAPAPRAPWFGNLDLRNRPVLQNAYWILSPVYAASGYKKTLAFAPSAILSFYALSKYDSAIEKKELANTTHLYPRVPGGEYAYSLIDTGEFPPSEIKSRLNDHLEALREWTKAHASSSLSLPRMRDLMARGTVKSAQEAAALNKIAYEAFLLVSRQVKSDPSLSEVSGQLIDREFAKLLLQAPEFKNRSEHDLLLLLMLLTPSFEVGGIKDMDLYDLMLESQTHQTALVDSAVRKKFKTTEKLTSPTLSLATLISPGSLLSVYERTRNGAKQIQEKSSEGAFLPPSKKYLSQRADILEFSGSLHVNDGTPELLKLETELDRWRYLMTSENVSDLKQSWLQGKLNDLQTLRQTQERLNGMDEFYKLLKAGAKPEPTTLCPLISPDQEAPNALFVATLFYAKDAAEFRKLSQADAARCTQEASLLNWNYWSARKPPGEMYLNELQNLLNQCPKNRAAAIWPCLAPAGQSP